MAYHYAAINKMNFANTWSVYAFATKAARDAYVAKSDGHWDGNNAWKCLAVGRREVGKYAANYNMSRNEYSRPSPFSGEYWGICDMYRDADETGIIGQVVVCAPCDNYPRVL